LLRVQRTQIGIRGLSLRDGVDYLRRGEERQLAVEIPAQGRRIGAAAAGMARVLQDGEAQRDLSIGPLGAR
jgi:hypothetical protein